MLIGVKTDLLDVIAYLHQACNHPSEKKEKEEDNYVAELV